MKSIIYFIAIMLLFGCKSKNVVVEKHIEKYQENLSMRLDSLMEQKMNVYKEFQKKQSLFSSALTLKSLPEVDSNGIKRPFHYKHYKDGILKEEIWLQGGEITSETESQDVLEHETQAENNAKEFKVNVIADKHKTIKKRELKKQKEVEVTGFQFGLYVWLFLIVVVLIILWWVAKRLKLPDRIKVILQSKGGK